MADPRSRTCNADNAGPIIPVINTHPPRIAYTGSPRPNTVPSPLAKIVIDFSPTFLERITHFGHPRARIPDRRLTGLDPSTIAGRITIIVFPKVDAPAGECLRVLIFMAFGSRVTTTRHRSSASIQAELEAHAMDLVYHRFDAIGPLVRVWNKIAARVALLGTPAVIDVDVLIAQILQAEADELIRGIECEFCSGGIALTGVLSCLSGSGAHKDTLKKEIVKDCYGRVLTQLFHPSNGLRKVLLAAALL